MIDVSQNYTFGLPVAASTYAQRVDNSLHILHVAMVAIFVLWGIFFAYCLIRFRHRAGHVPSNGNGHGKGTLTSFVPDALILAFEVWLIFSIGLPTWSHIKEEFPDEKTANVVEMTAEQFAWAFQSHGPDGRFGKKDPAQINSGNTLGIDYNDPASKDDVVTLNELHVPLGKPTLLYMSSKDVIHSFFIPEFRVKQDVVPGMRIPLWFEPTRAGRYEIGCAQLCGLGHYRMRGEVVVYTPEEFAAWEKAKQQELVDAAKEDEEQ
jgi:cytochrome c oxidase subunit 2